MIIQSKWIISIPVSPFFTALLFVGQSVNQSACNRRVNDDDCRNNDVLDDHQLAIPWLDSLHFLLLLHSWMLSYSLAISLTLSLVIQFKETSLLFSPLFFYEEGGQTPHTHTHSFRSFLLCCLSSAVADAGTISCYCWLLSPITNTTT